VAISTRTILAAALLAGAALSARPASGDALPASDRAALEQAIGPAAVGELAFLEHLGWTLVVDPAATDVVVRGGKPATRADLASSRAAGDLVIALPPRLSPEKTAAFGASLPGIVDGVESRCAWQSRVQKAVERAAAKLSAAARREDYTFPKVLAVIDNPFFSLDAPQPEWRVQGDLWVPTVPPSKAIEAFWTKKAIAECFVAQTVASLAIQYEMYASDDFDAAFTREEMALGWVKPYYTTPFGHAMDKEAEHAWRALLVHESQADEDPGLVLARLGPRAFAGLTGILMDQAGSERGNENFVVVSVTDAACAQLRDGGGFSLVSQFTQEALDLDARVRQPFATAADTDPLQARIRAIGAEPVMSGIRVYIHPYGVVTFAEMAHKKRRKERTAIEAVVYAGGREDAYYRRYHDAFLARRKGERLSTPPSPPASEPSPPRSMPGR
jgi:hypothetical protein